MGAGDGRVLSIGIGGSAAQSYSTPSTTTRTSTMGREAQWGEGFSGTGSQQHNRTLRYHSQEGFLLTPKNRPGPGYGRA
jgi:hypothetical protein